ncbi:MAG: hypothetical protein JNL36_06175 [Candidatus Kapabacteria bacterium]|nr:hypothetical protein [Candidatus Kapabacteria bacterium]
MIKSIDMENKLQQQSPLFDNSVPLWMKIMLGLIVGGSTLWGGSSLGEVSHKITVIETEMRRVSFALEQQTLWKDRIERDVQEMNQELQNHHSERKR